MLRVGEAIVFPDVIDLACELVNDVGGAALGVPVPMGGCHRTDRRGSSASCSAVARVRLRCRGTRR